MNIPEFKNPKFSNSIGAIDCEINHPQYGWIPFTCVENDTGAEFDASALYQLLLAASPAAYVQPEPTESQLAEMMRMRRNALLSDTDWTQMPDLPNATKVTWAAYRDALRNIPQQEGFPKSIVWPEIPQ